LAHKFEQISLNIRYKPDIIETLKHIPEHDEKDKKSSHATVLLRSKDCISKSKKGASKSVFFYMGGHLKKIFSV
jgi:hypothetical protein